MPVLGRAGKAVRLLADLWKKDPAFVRGGDLSKGEIPVFTFHSLEPRSFESLMTGLRDDGYRAITMSMYLNALTGARPAPDKSILITIDDGRASTWTVAYPILRKLEMHATSFVVTSAVHESDAVSKHVGDASEAEWPELAARDLSADLPFVTWGEVRAMRDVIDVESHTHWHALVPMGAESEGVRTEGMASGYGVFDCPFVTIDGRQVRGPDVPHGYSLPASAPRLMGRPAYRAADKRFETESEMLDAMRFELVESRRLLREKADVDARALCYPWHVFSDAAKTLAREAGYTAAFAGKSDRGAAISCAGSDLFEISRVGAAYAARLPGRHRRTLPGVLLQKLLNPNQG